MDTDFGEWGDDVYCTGCGAVVSDPEDRLLVGQVEVFGEPVPVFIIICEDCKETQEHEA